METAEMNNQRQQRTVRLADPIIHSANDLLVRIRKNPASAAEIAGMDRWDCWLMEYGMTLVGCGLEEWEAAALECLVRDTPADGRLPQRWLFEGGPSGDNRKLLLPFLNENARKVKLTRFISKMHKLGRQLGLTFKLERAADCSKTIYTATTSAYACAFTLPPPQNGR
jgi:hypothetical protein